MKSKRAVFAIFALGLGGAAFAGGGAYPEPYLARETGSGATRAAVIGEVPDAQRQGRLDFAENEWPASVTSSPGKSRAEVVAEMEEAQRLGLLMVGDGDVKVATAEQERQIAEAGRRAAGSIQLAGK